MDILINKSYKNYNYTSRYSLVPYYYNRLDDKYVSGITKQLKDDTSYTLYTVKQSDTFDSLALDFYNNPTLYWVICDFNHIQNPYTELVPGEKIKIPAISALEYDFDGRE